MLRAELRGYRSRESPSLAHGPSRSLADRGAVSVKHVLQNMYRLHAIILSRSPFLAHLMSTSPQSGGQRTIYVHLEQEPEVTHEVSPIQSCKCRYLILSITCVQGFAIG